MNERITRIDNFFKELNKKNITLSIESILSELKNYDIPKEKLGKINGIHEELIDEYRNNQTINVFKHKETEPFCHLLNLYPDNERWENIKKVTNIKKGTKDKKTSPNKDPIKIYLSLDKEHILKGTKLIFNFLANEDIEHISKVSNNIRTDEIIIRVFNEKDAQNVINFINTNPYLNQGYFKPNPFLMTTGIIGLAQDNYNSYYTVLAAFIKKYLEEAKRNDEINKTGYLGFWAFVENYEIKVLDFIKDARKTSDINYQNDVKYIEEIKKLILINLKSNNLEDFYNHFKSVRGNKNKEIKNNYNVIETITKAYNATKNKYGVESASAGMIRFLQTGEANAITRMIETGENVREQLKTIGKEKCKEELLKYTNTTNIIEAVTKIEQTKQEEADSFKYDQIIDELQNAFNATYEKYGKEQAVFAMKTFLESNFARYITRYDSNKKEIRDRIKLLHQEVIKKSIKKYCEKNNIEVKNNNYIEAIINEFQNKKETEEENIKRK